ncbi:hypothetical protein E4U53_004752 [Claviceps sorghi]|nr:hypothetical protein E4U53_004752 [Claviceps sorghi]
MTISQQLIAEAVTSAARRIWPRQAGTEAQDAAAPFRPLAREPATPRPATLPTSARPSTASRRTRPSRLDVNVMQERLTRPDDLNHHTSHHPTTTSPPGAAETRDAADAGHSLLCSSRSHKRLFHHHGPTGGACKRRKLVDAPPSTTEGIHQHQERSTFARRALPDGRGFAAARPRETRRVVCREDGADLSAAGARLRPETEARQVAQEEPSGQPDQATHHSA